MSTENREAEAEIFNDDDQNLIDQLHEMEAQIEVEESQQNSDQKNQREENEESPGESVKTFQINLSKIVITGKKEGKVNVPDLQKDALLDALNKRDEEIQKLLNEPVEITPQKVGVKGSIIEKLKQRGVVVDTRKQQEEEECTFKPKLTSMSKNIPRRLGGEQNTNEALYRIAMENKAKNKMQQAEEKKKVSQAANSNKISANSIKIILKKIENTLRHVVSTSESEETQGYTTFQNLGTILKRIGFIQGSDGHVSIEESANADMEANPSPTLVKTKLQRSMKETEYHENLWKILLVTSDNETAVPSETIFRFLMVLVEEKTSVPENAAFLREIIEFELEEQQGIKKEDLESEYKKIKEEKELWELDRLVIESRKLFANKTIFMNLYNSVNVVSTKDPAKEERAQLTFQPKINPTSKYLAMNKTTQGYEDKVKTAVQQRQNSPSKVQTRNDLLFEHHKYLAGKRNEYFEAHKDKELRDCTFRPSITEYKVKAGGDISEFDANGTLTSASKYGHLSNQDLSKFSRHDLLYEVGRAQKERKMQKAYERKKEEEEREMANCTFQPKVKKGGNDSSPTKFRGVNSPAPKGYEKAIERLHTAERIREEKRAEMERVPRGENYEKIRNTEFNPPSFLTRPKTQKEDTLVYVDVNIAPGKTGRIGIHKGNKASVLAKNFAKTYSLPFSMRESLTRLLQSYIDNYFPETDSSPNKYELDEQANEDEQGHYEHHDEEEVHVDYEHEEGHLEAN